MPETERKYSPDILDPIEVEDRGSRLSFEQTLETLDSNHVKSMEKLLNQTKDFIKEKFDNQEPDEPRYQSAARINDRGPMLMWEQQSRQATSRELEEGSPKKEDFANESESLYRANVEYFLRRTISKILEDNLPRDLKDTDLAAMTNRHLDIFWSNLNSPQKNSCFEEAFRRTREVIDAQSRLFMAVKDARVSINDKMRKNKDTAAILDRLIRILPDNYTPLFKKLLYESLDSVRHVNLAQGMKDLDLGDPEELAALYYEAVSSTYTRFSKQDMKKVAQGVSEWLSKFEQK